MSDSSPPPKPKPGSLRDRIAAFEHKPTSSPAPPPATRPKPGNLSQWKPRASSPPDAPSTSSRIDNSMSASDAKESITKGGSLKDRMAALQGLGAFGGGPAVAPPPKPAEKPKWKPPPQISVAPPITGDVEDASQPTGGDDHKSVDSLSRTPNDEIMATLSKPPQPAKEEPSEIDVDPEEEERQRRTAIAARMARLGGTRVGMGPPIFGRKPEIKPKPAVPPPEATKEEHSPANVPATEPILRTERDVKHAQAEAETAANVPLPTSPPTNETASGTLSLQPQNASAEYFPEQPSPSTSPSIPPRGMPAPQGPRRTAPPRKKVASKSIPPAETEVATLPLEQDTPIHGPDVTVKSQSPFVSVPSHVESEVGATHTESADKRHIEEPYNATALPALASEEKSESGPLHWATSQSSEPRPESPNEPGTPLKLKQDPLPPGHATEPAVQLPPASRAPQEELEDEGAAVREPGRDQSPVAAVEEEEEKEIARRERIAERVAKAGVFEPLSGQPLHPPSLEGTIPHVERKASSGSIPIEGEDTALESQPATMNTPLVPHAVFQQDGSTNVTNEGDDEDDESDLHAQALLQHVLEDELLKTSQGAIDYDDADPRVTHEADVQLFTQVAGSRQGPEDRDDDSEVQIGAEATSSPSSAIHGQHTADGSGAAQVHAEGELLAPTLLADDVDENEMAPPRVTRPLPPAPIPPTSGVSAELTIVPVRAPPAPIVPKRTSLLPPTRGLQYPHLIVPQYSRDNPRSAPFCEEDFHPSTLPFRRGVATASVLDEESIHPSALPCSPSPSVLRSESLIAPAPPPPPPPPPSGLGLTEQERPLTREPEPIEAASRAQDEPVPLPPSPPVRKATIPPPTPNGRRNEKSRRSTDSRASYEERRGSGQYAVPVSPPLSGPSSPLSRKRGPPPPLSLEQEILDEDYGDPIDPRFYSPPITAGVPRTPPPTGVEPLTSVPPASSAALRSVDEPEEDGELRRKKTIAERMAKLGGIKFGAPPPIQRVQPSVTALPADGTGTEDSAQGSGLPAPEQAEEQEEEEDEQTRRQRIAAKLAGMGGMRLGMLPIHHGVGVAPPPPPPSASVRHEEEATPRSSPRAFPPSRQPSALQSESDQEYEHPSSSDDGVQVEAEESELEEVLHEDLEDEYSVEEADEEEEEVSPSPPPPPPPRSARPPVPSGRPPVLPTGRRPSTEIPLTPPPRSVSVDTVTSAPRPPIRQAPSDFVMVEAEEAQPAPPAWPLHSPPPPPRTAPPPPESYDLAGTGQWELPSIPSGSLDLGDSGAISDLSASMWSEDSTAYPATALSTSAPLAHPSTSAPPQSVGQPRGPAGAGPGRMTADELRAVWGRVGVHVAEAASGLLERSKRTLVGNGSYEGFIAEALALVHNASPPNGPGEYGFLVYAQTAAQVHTRLADIMPGDVVVLENAKLKGHKGLHTYSMSAGESTPCMGIVSEFDAKKLKLRALQANQRVGQATVEAVSYRLEDLKGGTIKPSQMRLSPISGGVDEGDGGGSMNLVVSVVVVIRVE
ncbi:hypothetical protein B0F90DRAFT_1668005 [Multifurca ochricompacta]|uniref:BBC1/AIM3 cysteine proteinase-fold domain-containing protein n=1 Tax=Multifurca ochricompacta TaxID=376703 RepID=A0AAD4QNQ2_9AGAM|nr:hypothetical protein B0F90DRAFT_1668005 [Multifurca ochricompacta]